jgi:hypothetical protein
MNKNKSVTSLILNKFLRSLITCKKCGTLEEPIAFEKVPDLILKEMGDLDKNSLFLYCYNCESWEIIKSIEKVV